MATREIDENEYAEWQRLRAVAQAIEKNPKARLKLQEAVAEAAPDQVGPEIRIRNEMNERIGGIESKLDEWMAGQRKDADERKAAEDRAALEGRWTASRQRAAELGYTAEGLEKLEAFMEKNGVADHELAIPAFEKLHPPPEPVVSGGSRWNFFDQAASANDEAMKALMSGNDEGFLQMALPAALKEGRGG